MRHRRMKCYVKTYMRRGYPSRRPLVRNHNVGRERNAYPLGDEGVDEAAAQLGGHVPAGGGPRAAAHNHRDPGIADGLDAGGPRRLADERLVVSIGSKLAAHAVDHLGHARELLAVSD